MLPALRIAEQRFRDRDPVTVAPASEGGCVMKLTGLVTALGSQPIGSSDRAATLTVYNGSEQSRRSACG
jgi:hypothetical protein